MKIRRGPTQTTLVAEFERLAEIHPELGLKLTADFPVPESLEPLAQ